jgi:hypothetical protein
MSKRSDKYKAEILRKDRDTPAGFEQALRLNMSNYSGDVYPRPAPGVTFHKDLIRNNMWAYNACKINARSSVGLGFTEDSDKAISENMYIKELKLAVENLQMFWEMFFEVKVRGRKALPVLYSVPSTSVLKGKKGKYEGNYVLNYGTKEEQIVPAFDPLEYELGRLKDGDYIYHVKEGYGHYGEIPGAAIKRLEIQNGFETSVGSWYKNDAIPDIIITMFNLDPDSEQAISIKNMINRNYQGAEKRGKATMLFSPGSRAETDPSIVPVTKNIVDMPSLQLDDKIKFDIAAFWGVPSWMLNLQVAGKLGNTQDKEADLMWYQASKLAEIHEIFRDEVWSVLYNGMNIEFAELDIESLIPRTAAPSFGGFDMEAAVDKSLNKSIDELIKKEYKEET